MGSARLLLVDDEPALTDLLKKYLERLGYEVDARSDAEQALEQYERNPDGYALVLTDLSLPGMSGEQMIERMRLRNPKLRAIISSGYPYQPRSRLVGYLQKPFLPKMLADLIEKMLRR
ncbi:MAG TPA: response regulator [Bryobacteraceae bacterium]|nr:response regulator [Bryobacteraceae bacterium]